MEFCSIHNQWNRRNLTQTEILRCIEKVDQLKERGGDKDPESGIFKPKASSDANGKSAQTTAKIVGVSQATVERARTVMADPEEKVLVLQCKNHYSIAGGDLHLLYSRFLF